MASSSVSSADQNSGQLSTSASVLELRAERESLHSIDLSAICENLSPELFVNTEFPDTSPKAILNQILSILKKRQVIYEIRYYYHNPKIEFQCKATIPDLKMISF